MLCLLSFGAHAADAWVLEGPRVLDRGVARDVAVLVVEDGRIAHLGAMQPQWADLPRVEGAGTTVVPGLFDAHVHLSMTPGGAFMTPEAARGLWPHHLAAYVASGVLAVLDTGITLEDAAHLDLILKQDIVAPTVRLLGPLISPEGGYVSVVLPNFPPTPDPEALTAQLEAFDVFDPIGVKVTMEDGMARPIWPLLDADLMAALRAQPRPLFVHAMESEEYDRALTLAPRAFVHAPDAVDDARIAALANIPVVTTLSVMDSMLVAAQPDRLDDPLVRLVVPEIELRNAGDAQVQRRSFDAVARAVLPGMPGFLRKIAIGMMGAPGPILKRLTNQQEVVAALHAGGVPLVVGSDSGNWPVFLGEFHGPTTLREMELLQQAGIPPADVIGMATHDAAALLGLDGELGRIAVGYRASFLVVDDDPLQDVGVLRDLRWVVLDGERRTPADWMRDVR